MKMNSDQLKQFKMIAEYGSITKAAERLYVTQPSLSIAPVSYTHLAYSFKYLLQEFFQE